MQAVEVVKEDPVLTSRPLLTVVCGLVGVVVLLLILERKGAGGGNFSAVLSFGDWSKAKSKAKERKGWPLYRLLRKEMLSPDVARFTFAVPPNGVKKLGMGKHMLVRAKLDGEERVVRPYTPTRASSETIELVVKTYSLGKLSPYLFKLSEGDSVEMFGPTGNLKYKPGCAEKLVLLTAGTGITPAYSMIKGVLADDRDARTDHASDVGHAVPEAHVVADPTVLLFAHHVRRVG